MSLAGTARFTAPRSLEVQLCDGGAHELTAEMVFLNTGTRPALHAVANTAMP
jgi:pyruvate/2-oxoglutarate dehydrogenase complex dihydrolipoamide dehydrogenase (E3) component